MACINWWQAIILMDDDDRLLQCIYTLIHWSWVTHKCVNKLTIIGSDNGLLPGQRQAIIWTNDRILLIGPLGRNSMKF